MLNKNNNYKLVNIRHKIQFGQFAQKYKNKDNLKLKKTKTASPLLNNFLLLLLSRLFRARGENHWSET